MYAKWKCNDVLKQYYVCKWIDCSNVDWVLIKLNVQEHKLYGGEIINIRFSQNGDVWNDIWSH